MSLKPTTKLMPWILLGLISSPVMAQTTDSTRASKSISFVASNATSNEINTDIKDAQLKQADAVILTPLVKEGFRTESNALGKTTGSVSYSYSNEVWIYNATTNLISDFDYDGFHHRFSVSIDADTIYSTSYVYAKLYLSFEGGPWNYYASSQNYPVHTDSDQDIFTIETELADGFPAGYYDVRIELYDAHSHEWLLNYGPYDDASLSSLPLEDSYYDDTYIEISYPVIETGVVVAGTGSMNVLWIIMATLIGAARRFSKR